MNSSIAAASLLGFGNQPASEALAEFGNTLSKIYDVQEQQLKEEASSRKAINDEYNKEQRAKKKRESDLVDILSGALKTSGSTRSKSGAKKKNMGLMSKILLGAGVALAGKALYDAVSNQVFDSVKETVEDMIDPILDTFEEVFEPVRNFFGGGDSGDDGGNDQSSAPAATGGGNASNTFTLIGSGEGGYNSVNRGTAGDTPGGASSVMGRDLTEMTVDEVVAAQQAGELFAVGKYQIIPKTMPGFLDKMGISGDEIFNQSLQEKFPQYVLDHKRPAVGAYLSGKSNDRTAAIQALSREFAAVGLAYPEAGRQRGQSRYAGMSGNKASISPEAMGAALDKDRQGLAKGGKVKKRKKRKGNGPKSEDTIEQVAPLKRAKGGKIFLHWAASTYSSASPDYHATIQGNGKIEQTRDYNTFGGGHTSERNSEGIGISLAAMKGADSGGSFGKYPVKKIQYENMAKLCAKILVSWGHGPSYVNETNVPTHAEAGRQGDSLGNYGPMAWGGDGTRWDLWKLYENDANGSGGPKIRNMIKGYMANGADFELESEDSANYVGDRSQSSGSTGATPGGVRPSGPKLPPPPKTLDDALSQVAGQALAPIIGLFGALSGNPVQYDMPGAGADAINNGAQSTGPGRAGAASINDPNARALLNAIADVEGTSGHPNNGYNTMFSGKQFNNLSDHPRQDIPFGNTTSNAAGRYQFLSTTWDDYAKGRDMSPANQDAVALDLVALKQGVNIADGLSKQEVYKLGREWASIEGGPQGIPGGSYNGQAKYSAEEFLNIYKDYGGKVQGLQRGGMVGNQINTGGMRGSMDAQMSKLREQQQRMKRKGPRIIQVPLPVLPSQKPIVVQQEGGSGYTPHDMTMSQLADFNRRLAMGALT